MYNNIKHVLKINLKMEKSGDTHMMSFNIKPKKNLM